MDEAFDLMVIGAGVNGAGIARDAALRGLHVLLLDQADVGGETSSWCTRLIHGGLRYLEHFEIPLVRQSLHERERLLRLAPHLVRPLSLLIPVYRHSRRGLWTIQAGMLAYDVLSLGKSLDHHHMLTRDEALARAPGLDADQLRGAAVYHDAQVEYPERLVLENVLDAAAHGAVVRTYTRVERFIVEPRGGPVIEGVQFTDVLTGERGEARAKMVINAAGPWVDRVLEGVGKAMPRLIGGTRGSHLVVGGFPGAPGEALYTEARSDGRPFFIIPWNHQYLIGTTDRRDDGDPGQLTADDSEIEYLLDETNRIIPTAKLTRAAIHYTYTGVRPLPFVEGKDESAVTRRHVLHEHDVAGLISIIGGKLTTYRQLAEEAVDRVCRKLGRVERCRTHTTPLPGASEESPQIPREFTAKTADHLRRVYGGRAREVIELARAAGDLSVMICPHTGAIAAEVVFAFTHEHARTLTDVMMRRTMAGLSPTFGLDVVDAVVEVARRHLQWDDDRVHDEVGRFRTYARRFHPAGLR